MIWAWRREDGRYRLDFDPAGTWFATVTRTKEGLDLEYMDGIWDAEQSCWSVPEGILADLPDVVKMFGVLAGPSSCGCEPAGFRWVTESEVKAGRTAIKPCTPCSRRKFHGPLTPLSCVPHQCDIIDVMGEADVAREVYEAEFSGKYEGVI